MSSSRRKRLFALESRRDNQLFSGVVTVGDDETAEQALARCAALLPNRAAGARGCLVVPRTMTAEEWEPLAIEQQSKLRDSVRQLAKEYGV